MIPGMQGASRTTRLRGDGTAGDRGAVRALMFGAITVVAIAFMMGATGGDAPTSVLSAMLGGVATSIVFRGVTPRSSPRFVQPRRYASARQLTEAREKLTGSRA